MGQWATAVDEQSRIRVCVDCGVAKPFCEFHTWPSGKPRAACKPCFAERGRASKTPERQARAKAREAARRKARAAELNEYNKYQMKVRRARMQAVATFFKARPCADCGLRFPTAAMEFDHVRPGKLKSVSGLIGDTHSMEALEREIALCEVVCCRCHRQRTYTRLMEQPKKARVKRTQGAELENKRIIEERKKAPCSECGLRFMPWQMDFDHIDGRTKSYNIARFKNSSLSTDKLRIELEKVRLLCANCHRIKTVREDLDPIEDAEANGAAAARH